MDSEWSRAVLAKNGELKDSVAFEMLPESTRGTVTAGLFDGTPPLPPLPPLPPQPPLPPPQ